MTRLKSVKNVSELVAADLPVQREVLQVQEQQRQA
jgi:hypothetical protein